jgi:NAD(P)H-hydrate epimerase
LLYQKAIFFAIFINMKKLTQNLASSLLKPRAADTHKGSFGHSLIIAGSRGKMGAAVIAAQACLRSGTGLLTVNTPQKERIILQTAIPEAMLVMREDKELDIAKFNAIAIGPGIGITANNKSLLSQMINKLTQPLLLDADALNIIAANRKLLPLLKEGTIITPHPKEFDRLFGEQLNHNNRIKTALVKAKEYKIIIVLKGHHTIIANANDAYENTTGNAGLAKGGSGDALTGIITALLAQGYAAFDAARLGVYLHGLAADIALAEQSMESMLITDVISCLGKAFKQIGSV